MYFNVDNMIAQGYSKVAKVKIPGIFYINTMNDSTVAFDFTRNHLQVREDSLTAVTPFEKRARTRVDGVGNASLATEQKPRWKTARIETGALRRNGATRPRRLQP